MRKFTPQFIVKHHAGVQASWVLNTGGDGEAVVAIFETVHHGKSEATRLSLVRGPWSVIDSKSSDPRDWKITNNPAYDAERQYFNDQAVRILGVLNAPIDRVRALKEIFAGPVNGFPAFIKEPATSGEGISVNTEAV